MWDRQRQAWALVLLGNVLMNIVIATPIYVPQFLPGSTGRNIRHLPCVSRRTGETGVCMFAFTCAKANGTHLGTCIDRFYFGSCCKIDEEPEIFPQDNSIEDGPPARPFVTTHGPIESNDIPEYFSRPRPITEKNPSGTHSTEAATSIHAAQNTHAAPTTVKETTKPATKKPEHSNNVETTTQPVRLSTFQTVQNSSKEDSTTTESPLRVTVSASTVQASQKTPSTIASSTSRPATLTSIAQKPTTIETVTKVSATQTTRPKKPIHSSTVHRPTHPSSHRPAQSTVPLEVTTPESLRPTTDKTSESTTSRIVLTTTQRTVPATRFPPRNTTTARPFTQATTRKPISSTRRPVTGTSTKRPTVTTKKPSPPVKRPAITPKPVTTSGFGSSSTTAMKPLVTSIKVRPSVHTTTESVPTATVTNPSTSATETVLTTGQKVTNATTTKVTGTTQRPKPTKVGTTTTKTVTEQEYATTTEETGTTSSFDVTKATRPTRPTTDRSKPTKPARPSIETSTRPTRPTTESTKPAKETRPTIEARPTRPTRPTVETTIPSRPSRPTIETTKPTRPVRPTVETTKPAKPARPSIETTKPALSSSKPLNEATSTVSSTTVTSTTTVPLSFIETTASTEAASTEAASTEAASTEAASTEAASTKSNQTKEDSYTTYAPGIVTWTSNSDDTITKTPHDSSTVTTQVDQTESEWTPITTPDGWIMIQSPTTKKPQISEDTTAKPIPESTLQPSTSAKPVTETTPEDVTKRPSILTTLSTIASVTIDTELPVPMETLNMSDYKQVCGRRLFPESRIVGGNRSSFGKWPWQISLRQWRTSTYLHKCGAALLNENWAITAAHCVENAPPSDLLLRIGEHDLANEDEPYGYQERRVQIVASHPQFDPGTFEYDLALLRFYEPLLPFQPNVLPICLPDDDESYVGRTAYVTGWGRLYDEGPLPSVLQEVAVPVINNTMCEGMYRNAGYIEHIPHIFICAGWKHGGFDSCEGDSGGPMVIQRARDKRWILTGVISWGIGCAVPNQPGVYTRISEFREWINQIIQF